MGKVLVRRLLAIEPHPKVDDLVIVQIDGFRVVVKKGLFAVGDLAAYIPEGSVLPVWVLKRLKLWDEHRGVGRLAGAAGRLVQAVWRKGVLSQGLLYRVHPESFDDFDEAIEATDGFVLQVNAAERGVYGYVVHEGDDVTALLGVVQV